MTPDTPRLSLADLENHDPHAPRGGRERRFACPFCGNDKPKDAAHRSVSANAESGAWFCWRCKASGKLTEHWIDRPATSRRERTRAALSRAFESAPPFALPAPSATPTPDKAHELRAQLHGLQRLDGTHGAAYLERRGVALDVARLAGARFAPSFFGRAAVAFPLRDRDGQLVAVNARHLSGTPKSRSAGLKSVGIFAGPVNIGGRVFGPLDADTPAVVIVEAPADALSLAMAGVPALAFCGTSGPDWLPKACAFRRVLLGFDADEAGDRAADELAPTLASLGARPERFRPEGAKDWNELIQIIGRDALADFCAMRVLAE